jgi:prepilin-type N-terminal cleavage/methylation domain-containing protein
LSLVLKRRGFTLVEALVSVVIVSVGIGACLGTMGAIARAQSRAADTEEMQRLAVRKYDELTATNASGSSSDQGDFQELGEPRFVWRAQRSSADKAGLDELRIDVARRGSGFSNSVSVRGLVCVSSGGNP